MGRKRNVQVKEEKMEEGKMETEGEELELEEEKEDCWYTPPQSPSSLSH